MIPFSDINAPIYVAGPVTGHDDLNLPAFRSVEHAVSQTPSDVPESIRCRIPHDIAADAYLQYRSQTDEQRDTIAMLACVDWIGNHAESVVLLPGWRDSGGTVAEVAVANRLGVPTYEVVYAEGVPVGVERVVVKVTVG